MLVLMIGCFLAIAYFTVICCMVAAPDTELLPATVNPFTPAHPCDTADPSHETLALRDAAATTLSGDWQTAEVATLAEVTELLDWLQNHAITVTDLLCQHGKFIVRWR